MSDRAGRREARLAYRALGTVGGSDPRIVLIAVLLVIGVSVLANLLTDWVKEVLPAPVGWLLFFVCAGFAVAMGGLVHQAGEFIDDLEPGIVKAPSRPVQCLILFLSPPTNERDSAKAEAAEEDLKSIGGRLDDPALARRFPGPWAMTIRAVGHHISRVDQVIVLGSADRTSTNGKALPGTHKKFNLFAEIVSKLAQPTGRTPRIVTHHQLLGGDGPNPGIDFEDLEAVHRALRGIYRALKQQNIPESDILVDITGGQKVNSMAGVAAAVLVPERRFQYVSTHDYSVWSFDVTHEPEGAAG